jgi:hypothetical protein
MALSGRPRSAAGLRLLTQSRRCPRRTAPPLGHELLGFPAGKHEDQVDALGLLGQLLDQMVRGQKPLAQEKPNPAREYRPYQRAPRLDNWACLVRLCCVLK